MVAAAAAAAAAAATTVVAVVGVNHRGGGHPMPTSLSDNGGKYAGILAVDTPRSLLAVATCGLQPEDLLKKNPGEFTLRGPGIQKLSKEKREGLRRFKAERREQKRAALVSEVMEIYRRNLNLCVRDDGSGSGNGSGGVQSHHQKSRSMGSSEPSTGGFGRPRRPSSRSTRPPLKLSAVQKARLAADAERLVAAREKVLRERDAAAAAREEFSGVQAQARQRNEQHRALHAQRVREKKRLDEESRTRIHAHQRQLRSQRLLSHESAIEHEKAVEANRRRQMRLTKAALARRSAEEDAKRESIRALFRQKKEEEHAQKLALKAAKEEEVAAKRRRRQRALEQRTEQTAERINEKQDSARVSRTSKALRALKTYEDKLHEDLKAVAQARHKRQKSLANVTRELATQHSDLRRRVEERLSKVEMDKLREIDQIRASVLARQQQKEAAMERQASEHAARVLMSEILEGEKRADLERVQRREEFARSKLQQRIAERDAEFCARQAEKDAQRQVATLAANAERRVKKQAKRQLLGMQEPLSAARYFPNLSNSMETVSWAEQLRG